MKITVLGAAGIQAQGVIRDLCTSPEVNEVVLADLEKTKIILEQRPKSWGENKTGVACVDPNDTENLRKVIRGSKVCAHGLGLCVVTSAMERLWKSGAYWQNAVSHPTCF